LAYLVRTATVDRNRFGCHHPNYAAGRCYGRIFQRRIKIHLFIIILMETINQATTTDPAEQAPHAPAKETKWYVLRVVSGKERKVKEYLDK